MALESARVEETATAHINGETCTACGLCAAVCPAGIPDQVPGQVKVELRPDRLPTCIRCGRCMAICPTRSIHVDGLSYTEHFFELPHGDLESEQFFDLLTGRRSVRVFKDTPAPREMLEKYARIS